VSDGQTVTHNMTVTCVIRVWHTCQSNWVNCCQLMVLSIVEVSSIALMH